MHYYMLLLQIPLLLSLFWTAKSIGISYFLSSVLSSAIIRFFFILQSWVLTISSLGSVTGYGVNPILNSVANQGLTSDYTFAFVLDVTVPAGGLIVISFPLQYDSGLGLSSTPTCSLSCTATDQNVTLTLTDDFDAGSSN